MEAEVGLAIPYAMQRLADQIAEDASRQALLQQNYTVTLSSGIGNPLTVNGSLTSAADILWHSIPMGNVMDGDGNRLVYIPDFYEFQGYVLNGLKYFCLVNERIYARSGVTGIYSTDLGDVTDPLTVTANFIPTVTSLPTNLDNEIVETLARIVSEKFPKIPVSETFAA